MRIADASGSIIVDGDSFGVSEFGGPAYIDLIMAMLGNPPNLTLHNQATPGRTMGMMADSFTTNIVPCKSTGPVNLVITLCAIDDLSSGVSPSDSIANHIRYGKACRDYGFRLIAGTATPRTATSLTPYFDNLRLCYNELLRSSWQTFSDQLVDVGAHPVLGDIKTCSNTTFYVDGMHWTPVGVAMVADTLFPLVKKELALRGFEDKECDSGIWTPTLLNWTNTGTPTITGTWTKSHGIVSVQALVTPGTSVSATSGLSSVGNLPFKPLGNGAGVHFANDNQAVYLGTGVVWGGALWTPTINSTLRVSISATYPTSE